MVLHKAFLGDMRQIGKAQYRTRAAAVLFLKWLSNFVERGDIFVDGFQIEVHKELLFIK